MRLRLEDDLVLVHIMNIIRKNMRCIRRAVCKGLQNSNSRDDLSENTFQITIQNNANNTNTVRKKGMYLLIFYQIHILMSAAKYRYVLTLIWMYCSQ